MDEDGGTRDRLIHGYCGIDLEIVWETATRFIPELKPHIAHVLAVENPTGEARCPCRVFSRIWYGKDRLPVRSQARSETELGIRFLLAQIMYPAASG